MSFPSKKDYEPPSYFELPRVTGRDLPHKFADLTPDSHLDMRTTIRVILKAVGASHDIWKYVADGFDTGYWRLSDGTSSPIWRFTPLAKITKMKPDPAAVGHDYAYFIGMERRKADRMYRRALKSFGAPFHRRWVMWTTLKLLGGPAYDRHARLRATLPNYGTQKWINAQLDSMGGS